MRNPLSKIRLALAVCLSLCASQAFGFSVSLDTRYTEMLGVAGLRSGHEEITRQAMNLARSQIPADWLDLVKDAKGFLADLDPIEDGTDGGTTSNIVIRANFLTDVPELTKASDPISIKTYWHIRTDIDYQTNPEIQLMHFLRNHRPDGTLMTSRTTCINAREIIRHITIQAAKAWKAHEIEKALFWLGHATHVIQDSFSAAHTQRDWRTPDERNSNLKEICYFSKAQYKILANAKQLDKYCYHNDPDLRDIVYIHTDGAFQRTRSEWPETQVENCNKLASDVFEVPPSKKEVCLKDEARLARVATAKYFYLFAEYTHDLQTKPGFDDPQYFELSQRLRRRFFEGPVGGTVSAALDTAMRNGIMRCDLLKNQ